MDMETLIRKAMAQGASDIHLVAGLPPTFRIAGEIIATDEEPLSEESARELIYRLLSDENRRQFERDRQLCFSSVLEDVGHVRTSVYTRLGKVEASIRLRSFELRSLEELGLPPSVAALTEKPNGLVLVTGPTGVGKTTTFYAMIDRINSQSRSKIITVEDPIEYAHAHKRSMVIQQELGKDAKTFHSALMHILRLDPDVICIGEMRDAETISAALLAAETGHLVIATLHTTSAAQTVERVLTAVPPEQKAGVAVQLSNVLRGVVTQALLPTVDRKSRALAFEVMLATAAVRNNIRECRISHLYDAILAGGEDGMKSMDMRLRELYQGGQITYETAVTYAKEPKMILDHGRAATGAVKAA